MRTILCLVSALAMALPAGAQQMTRGGQSPEPKMHQGMTSQRMQSPKTSVRENSRSEARGGTANVSKNTNANANVNTSKNTSATQSGSVGSTSVNRNTNVNINDTSRFTNVSRVTFDGRSFNRATFVDRSDRHFTIGFHERNYYYQTYSDVIVVEGCLYYFDDGVYWPAEVVGMDCPLFEQRIVLVLD